MPVDPCNSKFEILLTTFRLLFTADYQNSELKWKRMFLKSF